MSAPAPDARPRLAAGVRLRLDRITGRYLLLRPEQGFELRGSALEIVRLCDGQATVAGIVDALIAKHDADAADAIAADVDRLLGELATRGLVEWNGMTDEAPRPYTLIAELTYRCPLRCAYCSNPVRLRGLGAELDAATWARVFVEAEALGVMQVNLTGGEPLLREDLGAIVAAARRSDLYTTLITSGLPLTRDRLGGLRDAGLDGVQLSLQDTDGPSAVRIAGVDALSAKAGVAGWIRELGLPLTLNVVLHRANLPRLPEFIALAEAWGAARLELAHVQLLGWALENRDALLPTPEMMAEARATANAARVRLAGKMEVLSVLPDYFTDYPRACMEGWGRKYMVVAPDGRVLPCHAAHTLPLDFESVVARPLGEIWRTSEAIQRFRGEGWMPEPCRSCDRRAQDFGGCRCQAFQLTGDMSATDPACRLAPAHDVVLRARAAAESLAPDDGLIRLRRVPVIGS